MQTFSIKIGVDYSSRKVSKVISLECSRRISNMFRYEYAKRKRGSGTSPFVFHVMMASAISSLTVCMRAKHLQMMQRRIAGNGRIVVPGFISSESSQKAVHELQALRKPDSLPLQKREHGWYRQFDKRDLYRG